MFKLTLKSMLQRKLVVFLCLLTIGLSSALYLGVSRLKEGARDGFTNTLSGADLIVGAKGGSLNLLLYTIFHLGSPTNNIRYTTYEKWVQNPRLAWAIPYSLGDSYRGFRVVGTTDSLLKHYRYQGERTLELSEGSFSSGIWGVTLGSEVARTLNHQVGEQIILSHGLGEGEILTHKHSPFSIQGILRPTGTPLDRSVFITLYGMEAMHIGWESGIPDQSKLVDPALLTEADIEIKQITSFIAKTKSPIQLLHLRRAIDQDPTEPLMAIIPGLELAGLWQMLGNAELVLRIIGVCVLVVGVIGIVIALSTSLQSRRREMAILRSVGGAPRHIVYSLLSEAMLLALLGFLLGEVILICALALAMPIVEAKFGLSIPLKIWDPNDLWYFALTLGCALILSFIPAGLAYRYSKVPDDF